VFFFEDPVQRDLATSTGDKFYNAFAELTFRRAPSSMTHAIGIQTLAKCPCGGSTEIQQSSNPTPISFGNWHFFFMVQEGEVLRLCTGQFGTPRIKKQCRSTGVTSSVVNNLISVSHGK